jgi:glutathione S-transferase
MEIVDKIDKDLSDGRKYLVGEHYSMADLVATCLLASIHFGK